MHDILRVASSILPKWIWIDYILKVQEAKEGKDGLVEMPLEIDQNLPMLRVERFVL